MEEPNRPQTAAAVSALLAILATLGVLYTLQTPFQNKRPSLSELPTSSGKIQARLWQDPFQAVLDYQKTRGGLRKGGKAADEAGPALMLKKEVAEHLERGDVMPLAVMVQGGPYGEEAETRIRLRYAALAALRNLGFIPEDANHLNFLPFYDEAAELSLETIVPYEWLEAEKGQGGSVLLLWLNEDAFAKSPLSELERLLTPLGLHDKRNWKLIGPLTSTTLLEMVKELAPAKEKGQGGIREVPPWLEIYSSATVAEEMIWEEAAKSGVGDETIAAFFRRLSRTIKTDETLAQAMAAELQERGVNPGDTIVLVAEWDTFYGRSLPETFDRVFQRAFGRRDPGDPKEYLQIHRYSYLRGLDGKLPGEQGDSAQKKREEADRKDEGDAKRLEEPLGRPQYDYLRRLAERIHRVEARRGERLKAIGIMGGDFYDKFLVLQALKLHFPDKIFFTTDLDARLLHPANLKFTRNLLVASSFDLQLAEKFQKDVPPFRDAYSTAVFASILLAGNPARKSEPEGSRLFEGGGRTRIYEQDYTRLQPLIFEIGQVNAVQLTRVAGTDPPINQGPQPIREVTWGRIVALLFYGAVVVLMLYWLWGRPLGEIYRQVVRGLGRIWRWVRRNPEWVILGGVFLLLSRAEISKEPFSLTEGISIWPTVLIRVLAMVLSVLFLKQGMAALQENSRAIAEEFELPEPEGREPREATAPPGEMRRNVFQAWWAVKKEQGQRSRRWLERNALAIMWDFSGAALSSGERRPEVAAEWERYLAKGELSRCGIIVVGLVVLYMAVVFVFLFVWGLPVTPARGKINFLIHFVTLQAAIISFLFLTFYVLVQSRLFRKFVRHFKGSEPEWDKGSLGLYCWEPQMRTEPLSQWMLIQLVARRTEAVGRLIYYPFVIWLVLFLARLTYFDNWSTPIGLALIILMGLLLAWYCAFMLRRTSENLKKEVLERLGRTLAAVRAAELLSQKPATRKEAEFIEKTIKDIRDIRRGAFAPLLEQPAIQALLVPFGGYSTVRLLEYFFLFT